MSLTGGYHYVAELHIEVVREIFHLAFKQEDRFPHNYGPFSEVFEVPGASALTAQVTVRVYDEEARAANLHFTGVKEITFEFPLDLEVDIAEAPSPELSHLMIPAVIRVPGALVTFPPSEADGEAALGIDFSTVTAANITIQERSPLPVIDSAALNAAVHQAYTQNKFPHQVSQAGFTLTVYDGNRDVSLSPANASGAEIVLVLNGNWAQVTLPVHVAGEQSGYVLNTFGTVTFSRPLLRTDEVIVLQMGAVPPATDVAHATSVHLDSIPGVDASVFHAAVKQAYVDNLIPHSVASGGGTLQLYDGNVDPTLVPANPETIATTLEVAGPTTYLHITIPCWATQMGFSSFGRLHIHREVVFAPTQISVNFATAPVDPARLTHFEMSISAFNAPLNANTGLVEAALDGIGLKTAPNPSGVIEQQIAAAFDAYSVTMGDIAQAAPSDARFDQLLSERIAAYLQTLKFPLYTPDVGDNDIDLNQPEGKILVGDEVLAVQLNRWEAQPDEVPENFLMGHRMALAVSSEQVLAKSNAHIEETFPDLDTEQGDLIEEITNRRVWLKSLSVTLADGEFRVSGSAVAEVCCWKDPEIEFSGPIFITLESTPNEEGGCDLDFQAVAGEFDISQSSCDIVLQIFIPVVGWIMAVVITETINAVGGGIVDEITEGQAEVVTAFPAIVIGIAEVKTCIEELHLRSDGLVMPGRIEVERIDGDGNLDPGEG